MLFILSLIHISSSISRIFKHICHSILFRANNHTGISCCHIGIRTTPCIFTSQQRVTGRGTGSSYGVSIGKANTFTRQTIDIGSLHIPVSYTHLDVYKRQRVCRNQRILIHKTFEGLAERGRCSMGWFFGFKLHLIINDKGEILNFMFTPGNVDDREPLKQGKFLENIKGKLCADKGYIGQEMCIRDRLYARHGHHDTASAPFYGRGSL